MRCPHLVVPILVLAGAAAQAATALPAAKAIVYLTGESTGVVVARDAFQIRDFGSYDLTHRGGLAHAAAAVGADDGSVPFIAFDARGSGQSFPSVSGQLDYSWSIQGAATGAELVPVTITTLGHVSGWVTTQALQPQLRVEASANNLRMVVRTEFRTGVAGGLQDTRIYGVASGTYNTAIRNVTFADPPRSSAGGSVTATGAASFSNTFTLMVRPNAVNTIQMLASGNLGNASGMIGAPFLYRTEEAFNTWQMSGYVDPVITIDPSYAGRFSLVQSPIPMVPVPEASTWALLLAGLGLLAGLARHRRRAV